MTTPLLRLVRPDQHPVRVRRAIDVATLREAGAILSDIDARGDAAVLEHAVRLGDLSPGSPCLFSAAMLRTARDGLSTPERDLLERVAARIREFALAQRDCLRDLNVPIPGGAAGHECIPVRSVGCYAPGGRFPLPSSVLMTAVTARAAGVSEVWVASPRPTQATLAAAAIAGADGLIAIGGAQAIGALANGLLGLPRAGCDMIVGPGNRWVTAAKQLVSDRVGIDMLAGPSELLILADETADAEVIAADLLAQAEHDEDAVPMLVTTEASLVDRVEAALERELQTLPTAATARAALRNGYATVACSMEEAIDVCNAVGPEHLEILTADAGMIAPRLRNAGAVFIGPLAAEVLGDYGAGPNHVLPTGGTSRFRAGLSVFTFLRARTWVRVDSAPAARMLYQDAIHLARIESLEGHARSAEVRLPGCVPMRQ
ncbi:MAG TPA: histidinol dehydrogenase [Phycisphaerales bacterium]|nr:histidinol dehydrogenase [Phycisphaerales bacterium]